MMDTEGGKLARKRRRRGGGKRFECTETRTTTTTSAGKRRTYLLVDDSNLNLSENNYPPRDDTAELAVRNALPTLLLQRQIKGLHKNPQVGQWQRKILRTAAHEPPRSSEGSVARTTWRPYATRPISFFDLELPYVEALLALDPSGSYMLTVCDNNDGTERHNNDTTTTTTTTTTTLELPTASLRIRAVPSPDRLRPKPLPRGPCSPCLLTIPLDFALHDVIGRFSKRKVIFSLCQDWRVGLYLGPVTNQPRDPAAHVTVFPLPRLLTHSDDTVHVYKTVEAVSFHNAVGSMEGYNLLWEVEFVPANGNLCGGYDRILKQQNGYLCILRNASELRFTWFTFNNSYVSSPHGVANQMPSKEEATNVPTQGNVRFLGNIFSSPKNSMWTKAESRRIDGALYSGVTREIPSRLQIAQESILCLDSLVQDILKHRPKLAKRYDESSEFHLTWKSEVIDVIHEGRILNLLLVFSSGRSKYPVAVVVSIDLMSQCYCEIDWMKSKTSFKHVDMRNLCATVRMKRLRCGPFESDRPDHESLFETENGSPGLHYISQNQEYCFMPLSALYTDAQIVSNSNILCAAPRMSMKSKSPVELFYYEDEY